MRHTANRVVLRKLQRGLSATETWREHWNIKINEDEIQVICFSHRFRPLEAHFTLNERNIPFVNHVKYLGIIFNKTITRRPRTEMTEAKAFTTFTIIYSLFKIERLSATIKLTHHKALNITVMPLLTPPVNSHTRGLSKLQRLQNKVYRTTGKFPRCTPVRDLHMTYNLLYVCDYVTKLCTQQAEVILNHENKHVRRIAQGDARQKKI
jgi:hypothetical protein